MNYILNSLNFRKIIKSCRTNINSQNLLLYLQRGFYKKLKNRLIKTYACFVFFKIIVGFQPILQLKIIDKNQTKYNLKYSSNLHFYREHLKTL